VIEGNEIRLLQRGAFDTDAVIVGMRGDKEDARGLSECVAELVQTRALGEGAGAGDGGEGGDGGGTPVARTDGAGSAIWDEWDM
jgi:hypothetical protein